MAQYTKEEVAAIVRKLERQLAEEKESREKAIQEAIQEERAKHIKLEYWMLSIIEESLKDTYKHIPLESIYITQQAIKQYKDTFLKDKE